MTRQCFLLFSAISVVIWFISMSSFTRSRHLSFGLPRFRFPSTVLCNIFLVVSSLSRRCTCQTHLVTTVCSLPPGKVDFVMILDGSGSICNNQGGTCQNWLDTLSFVRSVIDGMAIGPDDSRVALITFGSIGNLIWPLDR